MAAHIGDSYNDLCRICAVKTSVLVGLSIFSTEGINRDINKKISLCLPIQIHMEDELPKLICSQCVYKLDLLHDFRQRSIDTEQMLISMLKELRECALNEANQIVTVNTQNELLYHGNDHSDEQALLALTAFPSHGFNEHLSIKNDYLECKVEIVGDDGSLNSNGQLTTQIGIGEELPDNFNTNSTSSSDSGTNQLIDTNWTDLPTETTYDNQPTDSSLNYKPELDAEISELPPPGSYYVSAGSSDVFSETVEEEKNTEEILKVNLRKSRELSCSVCNKLFKTMYKLREHERTHSDEKPFSCSTCDKVFRSKIGLMQHEAAHTGDYAFTCEQCGKGFQCRSYLQVHQRVHDTKRPHSCDQCSSSFKTKQALLDHINRHLGVKPYKCQECQRAFVTKGLLKAHMRAHERQRAAKEGDVTKATDQLHPCNVCQKRFVSKSYLQTHMRIHNDDRRHICESCGKRFLTPVDLRIHATLHTGEKRYVCEQCGKAFARRDALRCHLRSHSGERPYTCSFCGQSFTQYTPMAIHMRLHTGQRPYSCDKCEKTFVSRSGLIVHKRKHNEEFAEVPKVEEDDKNVLLGL